MIEVVGDGSVVIGGVLKSRSCERLSGCKGDRCLLSILLHEGGVLFRICQDGYMSIIFGACTDHGRVANIDILRCNSRGYMRIGRNLLEWVEVYIDQLNRADFIFVKFINI